MFDFLKAIAGLGFLLWGIYKGCWVCRKVYKWLKFKYQCWEYEQNFINGLAAQIRYEREHGRVDAD